ncbi:MAG: hypothetical protein R2838_23100 [Caldilineaceae bacterium]
MWPRLLRRTPGEVRPGAVYRPLPRTVFPVTDVVEAFRYMAAGKHMWAKWS